MSPIILFDLPSKEPRTAWSPNPWKTRILLNFKGINYETKWLEYPELVPTFEKLGITPIETSDPTAPKYTIPTVRLGVDEYVMDSRKIATEIEKRFPNPSIHLDSPVLPKVEALIAEYWDAARLDLLPRIPAILPERSAEYFEHTRMARFGISLAEMQKTKGGEAAWSAAAIPLQKLVEMLKQSGGPFFLGKTPSYADIYLISMIHFAKRVGKEEEILSIDASLSKLYQASAQWIARDDH